MNKVLKEKKAYQSRILYTAKVSFKIKEKDIFSHKNGGTLSPVDLP